MKIRIQSPGGGSLLAVIDKLSKTRTDTLKGSLRENFPLRLGLVRMARSVKGKREACVGVGVGVEVVGQTRLKVDAPTALFLLPNVTLKHRVVRPSVRQGSLGDKPDL